MFDEDLTLERFVRYSDMKKSGVDLVDVVDGFALMRLFQAVWHEAYPQEIQQQKIRFETDLRPI
jgi:hypothetical protein